ncbi:MAG: hypothetical protein U0271_17220 [Polyangiaceae bacterium]
MNKSFVITVPALLASLFFIACGSDKGTTSGSNAANSSSSPASSAKGSAAAASSAAPAGGKQRPFKFADLYWNAGLKKVFTDKGDTCDPKAEEEFIACMSKACDPVAKECHGDKAEAGEFSGPCKDQDTCTYACKEDDTDCIMKCIPMTDNDPCMKCGMEKVAECIMKNSSALSPDNPCKVPCKGKE